LLPPNLPIVEARLIKPKSKPLSKPYSQQPKQAAARLAGNAESNDENALKPKMLQSLDPQQSTGQLPQEGDAKQLKAQPPQSLNLPVVEATWAVDYLSLNHEGSMGRSPSLKAVSVKNAKPPPGEASMKKPSVQSSSTKTVSMTNAKSTAVNASLVKVGSTETNKDAGSSAKSMEPKTTLSRVANREFLSGVTTNLLKIGELSTKTTSPKKNSNESMPLGVAAIQKKLLPSNKPIVTARNLVDTKYGSSQNKPSTRRIPSAAQKESLAKKNVAMPQIHQPAKKAPRSLDSLAS
jgi:hypothetical protein